MSSILTVTCVTSKQVVAADFDSHWAPNNFVCVMLYLQRNDRTFGQVLN